MTRTRPGTGPATARAGHRAERRAHADYTGGVHGSMLAASVVIGAGSLGSFPRTELVLLLLLTGTVFWIAHVHAQLFGARLAQQAPDHRLVMRVCRDEWPIVKAAVPPAAGCQPAPGPGCARCPLVRSLRCRGRPARRAGASPRLMAATATVNLS